MDAFDNEFPDFTVIFQGCTVVQHSDALVEVEV